MTHPTEAGEREKCGAVYRFLCDLPTGHEGEHEFAERAGPLATDTPTGEGGHLSGEREREVRYIVEVNEHLDDDDRVNAPIGGLRELVRAANLLRTEPGGDYDKKRLEAYDRALNRIAGLGMDAPPQVRREDFHRDQLQAAIGLAARTVQVWGWSAEPLGSEEALSRPTTPVEPEEDE